MLMELSTTLWRKPLQKSRRDKQERLLLDPARRKRKLPPRVRVKVEAAVAQ
jgi:hypothetical protein